MSIFFSDIFRDSFNSLSSTRTESNTDSYRVSQSDGLTTMEIDMPGVSRSDVSVEVTSGNILIVNSKRTGTVNRSYDYQWALRAEANVEGIASRLEAGVLTVTVPFRETVRKALTINVE